MIVVMLVSFLLSASPYIPWDTGLFLKGISNLRMIIGSALNIGFWIFLIVTGVYLVIKLVGMIGN